MDNVNSEQILRYLDGEMTPEERQRFEGSLSQNKPLADESHRLSLSVDAVKYYGVVQEVQKVHQDMKQEGALGSSSQGRVIHFRKFLRYGMAAAAILLFIFIGIKTFEFFSLDSNKLYQSAFVDYQIAPVRGSQKPATPIATAYQQGDHAKVISLAKERKTLDMNDQFFTGISNLLKEDLPASIRHLEVVATNENDKKADAEFYLALAYLKNGDLDKSVILMDMIRTTPLHPYQDRFSEKYIQKVRTLKWK